ncbi:MAG: DegT/DnrJ/EryC1/StrS family aminotransferase [Clostridium sp.]
MINLPLATESWDEKELTALERVINSGMFTMGKEVRAFEEKFAKHFGSNYAVMINSGSSANLLAVAALIYSKKHNLKAGDEVIVPAVSWATTYSPLAQYGLKLKFIDIDINTLNLDLNELEKAITKDTKAIFAVNLLGNSIDYDRLLEIVEKNNLILIEDNCESMGGKYKNKFLGTYGVMGTFSSFFSHHISTMEGGMIVTDDKDLYDILKSLRAHGWTRDLSNDSTIYNKKNDDFYETFNFILPGYNLRPLEIEGALGQEQLEKLNLLVENRRKNGKLFESLFSKLDSIIIQKEVGEASYFGFAIIVKADAKFTRNDLVTLLRANKVECRPIVAGNFTRNEVIKYFNYEIFGSLDNANLIHENGLFIGNHHFDIEDKLFKIYKLIKELE